MQLFAGGLRVPVCLQGQGAGANGFLIFVPQALLQIGKGIVVRFRDPAGGHVIEGAFDVTGVHEAARLPLPVRFGLAAGQGVYVR